MGKESGRRGTDARLTLFARAKCTLSLGESSKNQKDSLLGDVQHRETLATDPRREARGEKCERKEKRPWQNVLDLWFLVLRLLYHTAKYA